MLVLTRKTNESVFIDGQIEVVVVGVRGKKVKLGFRAPANVSIQRQERACLAIDESVHRNADGDECGEDSKNDLVALFFDNAGMRACPR